MKTLVIFSSLLMASLSVWALPECIVEKGTGYPYRVYDSESKLALGTSGYLTEALCLKAIQTKDFRIVCAPMSKNGQWGSVITRTATGNTVGFQDNFFTSVEYCSKAIDSTRGDTVCVPGPGAGVRSRISLIDFVKGTVIGYPYSSVEFCKWASLSASFTGKDPYICAMNGSGQTEIYNRATGQWQRHWFAKVKDCYNYLELYRKN